MVIRRDPNNNFSAVACIVLVFCSALVMPCLAEGDPASGIGIVIGKVTRGRIRTAGKQEYRIFMDEKGEDLSRTMKGVEVTVRGEIFMEGGDRWLKVYEYVHPEDAAAHELWRRMRCNACVVQSAAVNVTPPSQLLGAAPVSGRYYSFKDRITAWDEDGSDLWIGMDNRIERINLTGKIHTASYGRNNELPDYRIYQVLSNEGIVWVVHRCGVAALNVRSGIVADLEDARASYAKACHDRKGAWVVADCATWRLEPPGRIVEIYPALPTGKRIRKKVHDGLWIPHWDRLTAHFISNPVAVADNVYVESYGSIYGMEEGQWRMIARSGWELQEVDGTLWFLGTREVSEYNPASGKLEKHPIPTEIGSGRAVDLLVADHAAWVSVTPPATGAGKAGSGGLGRLDLDMDTWQIWKNLDGYPLNHVSCLKADGSDVWAAAASGVYTDSKAHPGMAYVTRRQFRANGLSLHRYDKIKRSWLTLPIPFAETENRMICGQDGSSEDDAIFPQTVEAITVNKARIFGVHHLFPERFFSGYWPCVNRIASRPDAKAPWETDFIHRPEQLNLQGEQPLVLNISNKGEMVLKAVGHDDIIELFLDRGTEWVVTEGRVAHFDETENCWRNILVSSYRWYWRATAAWDDGRFLYIGSDRGLISRLDSQTGQFRVEARFGGDRAVDSIFRDDSGQLVAIARQSPMGKMPEDLPAEGMKILDCEAAALRGDAWVELGEAPESGKPPENRWLIKLTGEKKVKNIQGGRDRSSGNFLFGPGESRGDEPIPRYYLKDIFWPRFLCESRDGKALWISSFTGLLRVDLPGKAE